MLAENQIYKTTDRNQEIIEEKFLLWCSLIDESTVEDKTKQAFKNVLTKLTDWKKHFESIEDAIYFTSHQLATIYQANQDQVEARALFSNINDDVWSLLKK